MSQSRMDLSGLMHVVWNWDGTIGILTGCQLDGQEVRVHIFSSLDVIQIGSVADPASYPVGTRGILNLTLNGNYNEI
jgi:hypothetical protein